MFSSCSFSTKVYFCRYAVALFMLLLCTESDTKLWKQKTKFLVLVCLGVRENPTLFGWSPAIQYCSCFVWVWLCAVSLCFCSSRPHYTGVERFVLSRCGSGGSGSVVLRADPRSLHAISCRCAPHNTHCCINDVGFACLLNTPQVYIGEMWVGYWNEVSDLHKANFLF